jgi:hypothetical protein
VSRTDKDRPYEVRLRDPHEATEEHHDHRPVYRYCVTGEETVTRRERDWLRSWDWIRDCDRVVYKDVTFTRTRRFAVACEAVCDLDGEYVRRGAPGWGRTGCYRSFLYQERWRVTNVPRWFTHANWFSPERVRERDDLRGCAREYNAGYDVDDFDFPSYGHRHSAAWDWD